MKFSVLGAHRDYFRKHQWIECEQLLSSTQLDKLIVGIQSALSKRLQKTVSFQTEAETLHHSAEALFRHGRDLWRESSAIKRVLLSKILAEIAAELIEVKPVRFGYDQLLPAPYSKWQVKNNVQSIQAGNKSLTPISLSLNEMSSLQGVVCGAIICIKSLEMSTPVNNTFFFPQIFGNIRFFQPTFPIPFQELWNLPGCLYEMVVYTKQKAVYCFQEKDPLSHAFQLWGYHYGDALKDSLNPIVYA